MSYLVAVDPTKRFGMSSKIVKTSGLCTVYEAKDNQTGEIVWWNSVQVPKTLYIEVQQCMKRVCQLPHYSLVQVLAGWETLYQEGSPGIEYITEVTSGITLKTYLSSVETVNEQELILWAYQIATAIDYLHSQEPIIHGNIRPDNIFFSLDMKYVRLEDVLSSFLQRRMASIVKAATLGDVLLLDEQGEDVWDEKDDIFAFGLCLFEIIATVERKARQKNSQDNLTHKSLIRRCLGPRETRPTSTELVNDMLFSQLKKQSRNDPVSSNLQYSANKKTIQRLSPSNTARHFIVQNQTKEPSRVVGGAQVELLDSPDPKTKQGFRMSIQIPVEESFKRIEFNFDPRHDSAESLAEEMVIELNLHASQFDMIKHDIEQRLQEVMGNLPEHLSDDFSNSTERNSSRNSLAASSAGFLEAPEEPLTNAKIDSDTDYSPLLVTENNLYLLSVEDPQPDSLHSAEKPPRVKSLPRMHPMSFSTGDILSKLFWESVRTGDRAQVLYHLERNPGLVHLRDADQRTPLHIAAAEGYIEIAKILTSFGARCDVLDRWGLSPLLEAVASSHQNLVQFFRKEMKGSNVSKSVQQDSCSYLPYYYPLFASTCSVSAQELVSIMYGHDATFDATEDNLHTFQSKISSQTADSLQPTNGSKAPLDSSMENFAPQDNDREKNECSEDVTRNISNEQFPTNSISVDFSTHRAELDRIEEKYRKEREDLERRFLEAKSQVKNKSKTEQASIRRPFLSS
eukprot:jgi/Galph1/4320/GphlegSOOS_G2964.1